MQLSDVPQDTATMPPALSVKALRQPAGGLDDSTSPPLSAAKQAIVLGQEMLVMAVLTGTGCTGIGVLHPGVWAGVPDAAGEVLAVGVPLPTVLLGAVFADAAAGPSGAVRCAA